MSQRIGVYVCECGPNIKDAIRFDDVVEYGRHLPDVVFSKPYGLLCSLDGKNFLANDIRQNQLTRVVIAACTPREHELTFRKILQQAGLNPYYLQIVNLRENCAWVIKDKDKATEHAKTMIRAAVKRVAFQEALETKDISCQPDVMVVGSGVAGFSAALTLASKQRKVYLVEKLPCIGGIVNRYGECSPKLECSTCLIEGKLDEVLHNEHIELLTNTQIKDAVGFFGNYTVTVNQKARSVDSSCIGCGACVEACPVKVKNEYNEGLDERRAVYLPYPGALPNLAVLDRKNCLRFKGQECSACAQACPFGSIKYDDQDRERTIIVGAVVLATGFKLFDPLKVPQFGYGTIDNVYTSVEMERLLSSAGPTSGRVTMKNGRTPNKIAIIHCVGSRSQKYHEHCSGVCCQTSLKAAHMIRKKISTASVVEFYSDFCLPGKGGQEFCNHVAEDKGVEFVRVSSIDDMKLEKNDMKIVVKYRDGSRTAKKMTDIDMVVLSLAMEGGEDSAELARIFDISTDKAGFFVEESRKIGPVTTTTDGVLVAGCSQGPREIADAVAHGLAAAGKVLARLVPGEKLVLDPCVASVTEDLCSGCMSCIPLCPYKAISFDKTKRRAKVNEALCRGCGVCVASCPSAAIVGKHFTDQEINAEIEALTKAN